MCPRDCVSSSRTGVAFAVVAVGVPAAAVRQLRLDHAAQLRIGAPQSAAGPPETGEGEEQQQSGSGQASHRGFTTEGRGPVHHRLRLLFERPGELAYLLQGIPDGRKRSPQVVGREARTVQRITRGLGRAGKVGIIDRGARLLHQREERARLCRSACPGRLSAARTACSLPRRTSVSRRSTPAGRSAARSARRS